LTPVLLVNVPPKHAERIVFVVLVSCQVKLARRHRLMFLLVHVKSKKPFGFRPFPPRFTAMIHGFLGVDSSIRASGICVVWRSSQIWAYTRGADPKSVLNRRTFVALHALFWRRQSYRHSSRPFRIISSAVKRTPTTIVLIVVAAVVVGS
jgi:hypothetical protein